MDRQIVRISTVAAPLMLREGVMPWQGTLAAREATTGTSTGGVELERNHWHPPEKTHPPTAFTHQPAISATPSTLRRGPSLMKGPTSRNPAKQAQSKHGGI